MLRVRVYDNGRLLDGGEELLEEGRAQVDRRARARRGDARSLAERFGLHKLAIEDCLHLDQRPKLEEYPHHQFIVLQGFSCADAKLTDVIMHELHFFLGPDWVITVHEKAAPRDRPVHKRIDADPANTSGEASTSWRTCWPTRWSTSIFRCWRRSTTRSTELEDEIFESPKRGMMQQIFELKRTLVLVRKVMSPQRDVVGLLARRGIPGVNERTTIYFRDVYDHLVRIYEQIDTNRDLLGNAMDAWLSVVANRTNDITKQLTILASIFLPLSFVVGFFGQNFDVLGTPPFFYVMLTIMAVVPLGMVGWFKHKDWW